MGRKTSIYLNDDDLERIRAAGNPPIPELIRAGLTALENFRAGPPMAAAEATDVTAGPPGDS